MDPREELYTELLDKLSQVEDVKHVDLWNQQTGFMEEEAPFEMPAVFVEFGDIQWNVQKDCFRGFGEVRLHTVLAWSTEAPVEAWRLTDRIWKAVTRIEGESFSGSYPSMTLPNNSHEDVFENIDVFQVKYLKPWVTD